jgi:hypothetical protein
LETAGYQVSHEIPLIKTLAELQRSFMQIIPRFKGIAVKKMKTHRAVGFINCVGNFAEHGFSLAAGDVPGQSEKQDLLRRIIVKGLPGIRVGATEPVD